MTKVDKFFFSIMVFTMTTCGFLTKYLLLLKERTPLEVDVINFALNVLNLYSTKGKVT